MQDNDIYDAMLNQTNVGDNNNKFYVIQLLGNLSTLFMWYLYAAIVLYLLYARNIIHLVTYVLPEQGFRWIW